MNKIHTTPKHTPPQRFMNLQQYILKIVFVLLIIERFETAQSRLKATLLLFELSLKLSVDPTFHLVDIISELFVNTVELLLGTPCSHQLLKPFTQDLCDISLAVICRARHSISDFIIFKLKVAGICNICTAFFLDGTWPLCAIYCTCPLNGN